MEYIIGVDIGTTSTKTIGFDLKGKILNSVSIEYPIINPQPSFSEQDPDEILKAVINSIKRLNEENKNLKNKPLAISFSAAMHSLIAVDYNGNPLTKCIIWADTRSKEYAEKLKRSSIGHEIYMNTGTPIHPMSPLCKLLWLKDNRKEIFAKAHKFISIKEYVFYKLFGEYVVDHSIASATGMFNIHKLKWDDTALKYIGINEDRLSKPVSTTYGMVGIKSEYIKELGLEEEIPFVVGASDGCLANLGVNAIKKAAAALTIGTSGAIRVISDKPKSDAKERVFSYILTEDHYVLGGPVNNGGVILRWFRDNFSNDLIEVAKTLEVDAYDLVIEEAKKVEPGAKGLIFLPYLLGERAPHWDASSKGVFFGVNITHKREHFIRAVMEGILYGLYNVAQALEETVGDIDTIYATGGFVRSEYWVQILADIFNKNIVIAESYESSCLGAAVLAMKHLGIIASVEEVKNFVPISKTFTPNKDNHNSYIKNYEIFLRLYEKLKDEFVEISKIQG